MFDSIYIQTSRLETLFLHLTRFHSRTTQPQK